MNNSTTFHGIIVPMVTPLIDSDTLDQSGLARLIEYILGGGVHGLFILGTTGEAPHLSRRLQHEMIEQTCKFTSGRVPVLVGVTHTSAIEVVATAEVAADSGADAVVLSAPYYHPINQDELLYFMQQVIPKLPLPAFLYNTPSCTKMGFEPDIIQRLLDLPNLVGLKDSSGDMAYLQSILSITSDRKDFSVFVGPEILLSEALFLGSSGGVNGGANLFPQLFVRIYQAATAGDWNRVMVLQKEVVHLQKTIYSVGHQQSGFLRGAKCVLSCLGICNDSFAPPLYPLGVEQREEVEQHLQQLRARANFPTFEEQVSLMSAEPRA